MQLSIIEIFISGFQLLLLSLIFSVTSKQIEMKKLALLFLFSASIAGTMQSCNKVKDAVKANVPLTSTDVEFDIPPVDNTNPNAAMGSLTLTMNVDSIIKAANSQLGVGNIQNAKLNSIELQITNNDDSTNFSNFSSASAAFHSDAKTTDVTIATATIPDVPASYLALNVNTTLELKDYMNSSSFYYTFTGQARRVTKHPLHVKATIKYDLTVSL